MNDKDNQEDELGRSLWKHRSVKSKVEVFVLNSDVLDSDAVLPQAQRHIYDSINEQKKSSD